MTNHQTPPHPENRRLNTQLMLPDTFLTISSDFMKFCDFSKISNIFDFFASKPWDRIRRCHWTASNFQDAKTFNPRLVGAKRKSSKRGAGVFCFVFVPSRFCACGANSATRRCDFNTFFGQNCNFDKGLHYKILEAKIEVAATGVYTSPPTFRFYI